MLALITTYLDNIEHVAIPQHDSDPRSSTLIVTPMAREFILINSDCHSMLNLQPVLPTWEEQIRR